MAGEWPTPLGVWGLTGDILHQRTGDTGTEVIPCRHDTHARERRCFRHGVFFCGTFLTVRTALDSQGELGWLGHVRYGARASGTSEHYQLTNVTRAFHCQGLKHGLKLKPVEASLSHDIWRRLWQLANWWAIRLWIGACTSCARVALQQRVNAGIDNMAQACSVMCKLDVVMPRLFICAWTSVTRSSFGSGNPPLPVLSMTVDMPNDQGKHAK